MAGKRFKGKPCVYCENGVSESTGDHVLARQFVLEEHRAKLPKVPCCRSCNQKKSVLEHYLTTILPFGGRHSSAWDTLEAVEPRLAKNIKLRNKLAKGSQHVSVATGGGEHESTIAIPFESKHLCDLAVYVALGLSFHHWGIRLVPGYSSHATFMTNNGENKLIDIINSIEGDTLDEAHGNGALSFKALKSYKELWRLICRLRFYGGLEMLADVGEVSNELCVIIGPEEEMKKSSSVKI